ncbi:MAG: HD domain-containing protein, partial [Anaerolineales bacterium]
MSVSLKSSPKVDKVRRVLDDAGVDLETVYLVGGFVRDMLLNRPSHDLDFVLTENSLGTARAVADALGGAYYTMDEEFQVGRVVLVDSEGRRRVMDFTAMQGETLEDDLRNRDFTVNAIAVSLVALDEAIDPLGGLEDLLHKRLRACSPTSLIEDPVRVLRAVRMAADYGLTLVPETRTLIEPAVSRLGEVSVERLRDEFLKLLDAPKPATSLRILDRFGVLDMMVPRAGKMKGVTQSPPHIDDVWEHSLHTVAGMERVLAILDAGYVHDNEFGGDLVSGLFSQRLGRYRKQISAHVAMELVPDRAYRPLLYLAAFCHDLTKPDHRQVVEGDKVRFTGHEVTSAQAMAELASWMRLSNAETRRLVRMVEGHSRPWKLAKLEAYPSRREV